MPDPFFTIALPTKNRPAQRRCAIQSVLYQTFPDFELIVCDNSDESMSADVSDVLSSIHDSRIRYIRTGGKLSMPDNWERSCDEATGAYVGILSDRSVFRRDALAILREEIQNSGAEVLTWWCDQYGRGPSGREFRRRAVSLERRKMHNADILNLFLRGHPKYSSKYLPKLLASCCHRSVLSSIKASSPGRCFLPVSPDYTSAFLILAHSEWTLLIEDSLYVSCGRGNGSSFRTKGELAARFIRDLGMSSADLVDRMPSSACFSHAVCLNDFMRVREAVPELLGAFMLDHVQYYLGCFHDYLKSSRQGADFSEELALLLAALRSEPEPVQKRVYADPYFGNAIAIRPNLRRQHLASKNDEDDSGKGMSFDTVFDALAWSDGHPRTPRASGHSLSTAIAVEPPRPWWKNQPDPGKWMDPSS